MWWHFSLRNFKNIITNYDHSCLKIFLLLITVLLMLQFYCIGCFSYENKKIFQMSDPPRRSNVSNWSILIHLKSQKPDLLKTCFLVHFNYFSWVILTLIKRKSPGIVQIIKKIKFEGVWNELFKKNCFQRQRWTKYIANLCRTTQ